MSYEVDWDTPGKALRLKMFNEMSLEEFIEINSQINHHLQECDTRIVLIVDAADAKIVPYGIERIKSTQTYLHSHQIERLLVVGDNKLNRLAMLLLFNLCRPRLHFCNDFDQAQQFLAMTKR